MFIIEAVAVGGVVMDCIMLTCVSNILPPSCLEMGKTFETPNANNNLNNKHTVKLKPLWQRKSKPKSIVNKAFICG